MVKENLRVGYVGVVVCFLLMFTWSGVWAQNVSQEFTVLELKGDMCEGFDPFIKKYSSLKKIPPKEIRFPLNFEVYKRTEGNKRQFVFENFEFTKDVYYQGFDLSSLLYPEEISFTVYLYNERQVLIRTFDFDEVKMLNKKSPVCQIKLNSMPQRSSLRVGNIKLKYKSKSYSDFENAVNLINTLLKDNIELDDCLGSLKGITFFEESKLIREYVQLLAVASKSNRIRAMQYDTKLGKEHALVADFDDKLQDVIFRTELLYESFAKQYAALGAAKKAFIGDVVEEIQSDIERSIADSEFTLAREQVGALQQLISDHNLGEHYRAYLYNMTSQINDSLFEAYVEVAQKALSRKVFSLAERYLDIIHEDRSFQKAINSGKLEPLEKHLFQTYLNEGDFYSESGDFDTAEKFYGLAEHADFVKYDRLAKKNLEKRWQNLYYKKSEAVVSNLEIAEQKEIVKDENKEVFYEKYLAEYDRYLSKAMIKKDASDFIACGRILDEAVELERKIRGLGYIETRASELLSSLNNPATYQKKLIRVNDYLDKGEFESAINEYVSAGELYYQARLEKYGLYYVNLFDFVDLKKIDGLYIAYAQYALKTSDLDSAFEVYLKIEHMGIVFPGNGRFQEILGARTAIRDQKKYPGANPKRILKDYLNGTDGLNQFKSAYLMMWKVS